MLQNFRKDQRFPVFKITLWYKFQGVISYCHTRKLPDTTTRQFNLKKKRIILTKRMSNNKFDALGSDESEGDETINNHQQLEVS